VIKFGRIRIRLKMVKRVGAFCKNRIPFIKSKGCLRKWDYKSIGFIVNQKVNPPRTSKIP